MLPYIYLPKINLKILIDTGASDSIMNPESAHKFPKAFHFQELFAVKSVFNRYTDDKNIKLPIFSEINIENSIRFRILKWHDQYDALIGTNDLKKLNANLNYGQEQITLNNVTLKFHLGKTHRNSIPVNQLTGYAYVPAIRISNFNLPDSIHKIHNGQIYVPQLPDHIQFTTPIQVEDLNNFYVQEKFKPPYVKLNPDKLRLEHLNNEEKYKILTLCRQYGHLFYENNTPLSSTVLTKHHIRVTSEDPVYTKPYRVPQAMQEIISEHIDNLLANKIIRPSISPYSSPVLIVPKKKDASGKIKTRMVINYSKINDITIEDKYPLPRIDEILDNLGKCQYFTCLDLAQGYHQMEMDPTSIEKTAFTTRQGHFEYTKMPFGLRNAPSSFQRLMNEVLRKHLDIRCFVYLDDIIIFSKSLQDHINDVKLIFTELEKANLKIQPDKSEFLTKKVEFLGHVITTQGITPNPDKIISIQNYPIPTNVKEIKSFLGLMGYYRRFIPDFAQIVYPMNRCTRKGEKIDITNPNYTKAFEQCKTLITNSPILAYPDFTKKFIITSDASDIAVGSVLSQDNHPIAFHSRTLNSAEKNYSTIEKELLSIVDATKHFRPYLFGRRFLIQTDHNPLVWLNKLKTINSRLIRWKIKLDEFEYDIEHLKGSANKVADALSRIEINVKENDNISMSPMIIKNPQSIQSHSSNDENQNKNDSCDTIHSQEENLCCGLPISEKPINHFKSQILVTFGKKLKYRYTKIFDKNIYFLHVTPENTYKDLIELFTQFFNPTTAYGIYVYHNDIREVTQKLLLNEYTQFNIQIALKKLNNIELKEEQIMCIKNYHDKNHNGISETYAHLKTQVYFPNLKNIITNYINKCKICLSAKYERKPYKVPFEGPMLPTKPLQTLHIDIFHMKSTHFLTLIDPFSKYAQAYHIADQTSISILSKLRHFFSHHNYPKRIVIDNAANLTANIIDEYLKLFGIEKHCITTGNSPSNSPVERLHSTIIEKIKILQQISPEESIENHMTTAITIYNQSIHSTTGYTPFNLLYGPYENEIQFDNDLTLYENYTHKRKQEVLPFLEHVYKNTKLKMQSNLDKVNKNRNDNTPPLNPLDIVYKVKDKYAKNTLAEPIIVTEQNKNKIVGKNPRNKQITTDIKLIKRKRIIK